jgi:hypothetical protein
MLFNILYQISNLMITKHVSAAVSEMSSALAVPLEILLFMWPFLAGLAYSPDGLSWYTCVATVLVVAGNVLYTRTTEGQSGQVTLLKNSQTEQQETDDDDTALNY